MFEEWSRPPDRASVRVSPPAQWSDGSDIRRNYNLMIEKQKDKITPENQDFFTPEYLKQEMHYVLKEIRQLEKEVKPLRLQYQALLAEKEKTQPSPGCKSQTSEARKFHNENSEEYQTPESLERDLAKERRHFSEGNRFRLQYELQVALQERTQIIEATRAVREEIENRKNKLEMKMNSDLANLIKDQDEMIDKLQKTLKDLKDKEQELKNAALEYMRDSAMSAQDEHEIEQLKKQLQNLSTIQLRKSSKYRKKRNELEKQKSLLVEQIEIKKKRKQEIERRDNWKKNLNIQEIVVTDEDYQPYQPKTTVMNAQHQDKLPPLVSKPIKSLSKIFFDEEDENEDDYSNSQSN